MEIHKTKFDGCFILKNKLFWDERGFFQETFNQKEFSSRTGLNIDFVQDNLSESRKGVLRGLHFQSEPFAQSKLIRVMKGEILDVIVDLRKNSKTFGEHIKVKMKDSEGNSIFVPKGMAHGFLCLSDKVLFEYKCDSFYEPKSENGIRFDDPDLDIDWEYPFEKIVLSEKDRQLPSFKSLLL